MQLIGDAVSRNPLRINDSSYHCSGWLGIGIASAQLVSPSIMVKIDFGVAPSDSEFWPPTISIYCTVPQMSDRPVDA